MIYRKEEGKERKSWGGGKGANTQFSHTRYPPFSLSHTPQKLLEKALFVETKGTRIEEEVQRGIIGVNKNKG